MAVRTSLSQGKDYSAADAKPGTAGLVEVGFRLIIMVR